MTENLQINYGASKEGSYQEILPQIESVIAGEDNYIANLANICAILDTAFGHLWTGFYLRDGDTLVLVPFQGPLACTRIPPVFPTPRGVCDAAAATQETQIVPDVEKFPGHIACSSALKSEIVVPLIHNDIVEAVLDIDSAQIDMFNQIDTRYLEKIMQLIRQQHFNE